MSLVWVLLILLLLPLTSLERRKELLNRAHDLSETEG